MVSFFLLSSCTDFRLTRATAYRFKCIATVVCILSAGIFIWRCHCKLNRTYIKANAIFPFSLPIDLTRFYLELRNLSSHFSLHLIEYRLTFKISSISNARDNIENGLSLNDDTKRNTTFTRFFAPLLFQPLHHFNSIRTILQNICSNKMENRHVISVLRKRNTKTPQMKIIRLDCVQYQLIIEWVNK